jgi:hypothetical protein
MDERVEAFVLSVLMDEGMESDVVRKNARRHLADCQRTFSDYAVDSKKDAAVERCRQLCHDRLLEEIDRHVGASTKRHLRVVLAVIDGPSRVPL